MKKSVYVLLAGLVISGGLIAMTWKELTQKYASLADVAPAAGETVPPKAPVAPVPAAVQAPVVDPMSVPTPQPAPAAPQAATVATTPTAAAVVIPPTVVTPNGGAPEDLKTAMQGGTFQTNLSFPLTEEKMVAFARAAIKVQKINSKWDIQIASAETDQMAIEYNNFAVEEISNSLQNMKDLTLPQYNELTQMTIDSKEFNSIYLAYKQLVQEGAFGKEEKAPEPAVTPAVVSTTSAPAATAATPAAVPVNPGTAPAPQGSTAPQNSQPAAR